MSDTVISVEHLSKRYRLGVINSGTLKDDLKIWFAQARGKPNPLSKVGETDHGNRDGDILWALKDINFTVQRGEALGIIGRNGAGKSTLLKILSRVTTPTEGHVRVKGRIASLLEVGTGFHPELTGRENIYLNGAIMGMNRAEVTRKFDEIVDFSGVEKFIDTPVKRYSSGMYVRLAFAVAAHLEPEILIVDEVLAVGDAEFQKKCLGKMTEVTGEGRTVLFVSHNLLAIQSLCSQSILMDHGSLIFKGLTGATIKEYRGQQKEILSASFENDKKKVLRIRQIQVYSANTLEKDSIDTADGFVIKVTYEINKQVTGVHAFIRINTMENDTILSTGDTDTLPERLGVRKPGKYTSEIHIPPRILNEGKYSITWSAGKPFQENFDVEFNAINFQLLDRKTKRINYIHQERPGILALDLDWVYEKNK